MAVNLPYEEDFFQRIVNVNWDSGGAVEFTSGGHLDLQGVLSGLAKAVISFWFRIPSSTLTAAMADWSIRGSSLDPNADMVLVGIVPLITWGETTVNRTEGDDYQRSIKTGPSFIGVFGGSDTGALPAPAISLRFQSQNASTWYGVGGGDTSFLVSGMGNFYAVGNQASSIAYSAPDVKLIEFATDVWNHLIVSFDASGPHGRLWMALNDENYSGNYFYPACPVNMSNYEVSGDANDIIAAFDYPIFSGGAEGSVTSGGFAMPTDLFGIPFTSKYSQYGREPVEMSDLQIFTGVTLDTNVETNRRAFIKADGTPESPAKAKELFSKEPAVLLRAVDNWKSGTNRGSLDKFIATPQINSFKPNAKVGA